MTVGYSAAGACWATASEATDAYYSSIAPTVTGYRDDGSTAIGKYHVMRYYKSGVWYESHSECNHQYTSATCYNYNIAAPTAVYGSCTMPADSGSSDSTTDPLTSFTDGHLLGWGVVAAMVAAWAIHAMRRAI